MRLPQTPTRWRWLVTAACGAVLSALVVAGGTGAVRYVATFWLYRGFPAPSVPSSVTVGGPGGRRQVPVVSATVQAITVHSPALGGYRDPVDVLLPPGYASHPGQRYPVLYLLHGFPGLPAQFIEVGQVATIEATLVAERKMAPMILVMPTGTRSFLADREWANGIRPGNAWDTFVARDLVRAIDARYRAIASAGGRGIGGLSEGGYGALNIALHHPAEFSLIESWSGYMKADHMPWLFGRKTWEYRYNSPSLRARVVASQLRDRHTYIWFYSATADPLSRQNRAFSRELAALGLAHHYFQTSGRHNWALWRRYMPQALMTASEHLSHG